MILLLKPIFVDKPWGGTKLKELYDYNTSDSCGEVIGVSFIKGKSNKIKNTIHYGKTLYELFIKKPELFGNMKEKEFPIQIKLLNAEDNCSVKVHPDNIHAKNKHNSLGKDECWYILDAKANTDFIIGHNANSKEEFMKLVDKHRWSSLFNYVNVKKGDFYYIEPGTVHAISKRAVLLEVLQTSEAGYRIYDYNRKYDGKKRELHIEEALEVIKFPDSGIIEYPMNKHFTFDIVHNFTQNYKTASPHGDFIFIIEGEGLFNETPVKKGDFVFISSNHPYTINGKFLYQKTKV